MQFRITGSAYLVDTAAPQPPLDTVDWQAERHRVFHSLSLPMQASFTGPAPGSEETDADVDVPEVDGIPTR
ncbi:hypothetical protein MCUN1_000067 [Malassezia cuniculi]|uniref:Uncharacterized protein n=1 Tax=Malassezia cuniculi TaxID=948313 RepID=A0AAF0J5D1_9BASI|nr:hypothetical protein MCUN1_000067 [Malassezia cuniculi]